eukprot:221802_1
MAGSFHVKELHAENVHQTINNYNGDNEKKTQAASPAPSQQSSKVDFERVSINMSHSVGDWSIWQPFEVHQILEEHGIHVKCNAPISHGSMARVFKDILNKYKTQTANRICRAFQIQNKAKINEIGEIELFYSDEEIDIDIKAHKATKPKLTRKDNVCASNHNRKSDKKRKMKYKKHAKLAKAVISRSPSPNVHVNRPRRGGVVIDDKHRNNKRYRKHGHHHHKKHHHRKYY